MEVQQSRYLTNLFSSPMPSSPGPFTDYSSFIATQPYRQERIEIKPLLEVMFSLQLVCFCKWTVRRRRTIGTDSRKGLFDRYEVLD